MANPEHLSKLGEGIEAWNQWRKEHPDVVPNLSDAELSGGNLSAAKLQQANLSGANLSGANLSAANISAANLSKASLIRVNLSSAELNNADMYQVRLLETVLGDTNLSEAKGLETCVHMGPSTLDHRTLAKSDPLPPLDFLRGCGLSDVLIDYLPSLLNQPFQFYSCFISYSTKDQEFAERLHADLQTRACTVGLRPRISRLAINSGSASMRRFGFTKSCLSSFLGTPYEAIGCVRKWSRA
jgi:hypothetical protein